MVLSTNTNDYIPNTLPVLMNSLEINGISFKKIIIRNSKNNVQ